MTASARFARPARAENARAESGENSPAKGPAAPDQTWMRLALRLARHGFGQTSPNPMVGAVLVRGGEVVGRGWHRRAGLPHAEIEAIRDAAAGGRGIKGATLYVTLEPCCTFGRTPPCTRAILEAGIRRVVVACIDPNPAHAGRGLEQLRAGGVEVAAGVLRPEAEVLNEAFRHWIQHRRPFVTLKAAMTLDGKIATASGESKWITSEAARRTGMRLRLGNDGVLVGWRTVLADDPALTLRGPGAESKQWRRIILDPDARVSPTARVVADDAAARTLVVTGPRAPRGRLRALQRRVNVWVAPQVKGRVDLRWLLRKLGREGMVGLLVEGGGETHARFLAQRLVQRVFFFYAPKILGGRGDRKAIGGDEGLGGVGGIPLGSVAWRKVGRDLLLTARPAGQ